MIGQVVALFRIPGRPLWRVKIMAEGQVFIYWTPGVSSTPCWLRLGDRVEFDIRLVRVRIDWKTTAVQSRAVNVKLEKPYARKMENSDRGSDNQGTRDRQAN